MTELSRLVEKRQLMEVSELEQELACTEDHNSAIERLLRMLDNHRINFEDKLRMVALYALRYEKKKNQIPKALQALRENASPAEERSIKFVEELLAVAGCDKRSSDLFGNKTLLGKASKFFSAGLKGVENIYTQHRALVTSTLDQALKGKLKTENWPFASGEGNNSARNTKFKNIIVFIVGGATYEEAAQIQALNEELAGQTRILLGGSCILNSKSFIHDITRSN